MTAAFLVLLLASGPPPPEASGTSWQPRTVEMEGAHFHPGPWMLMVHGFVNGAAVWQDGPRGDDDGFLTNMAMVAAERALGPGAIGLRAMASLEPVLGPAGYPLRLQTGETADGRNHLVDRQHPHDLAMELSVRYRFPTSSRVQAFVYAGLPGEPALGPPAFMHRPSAGGNPAAPLSHHWLDSTHLTYGVITAGTLTGRFKLDGSVFTGREPDQHRWGLEAPHLDSYAARFTWNPAPAWSAQVSAARIASPEALHPTVDVTRLTASVAASPRWNGRRLDLLLAYGLNRKSRLLAPPVFPSYNPARDTSALLFEAALGLGRNTLFTRAEWIQKDELFPRTDAFSARVFPIGQTTVGVRRDLLLARGLAFGLGASTTLDFVPDFLAEDYGRHPWGLLAFARVALR